MCGLFVVIFAIMFLISTVLFCSNEKDSQGENMFMRCVSELVIESREVSDPHLMRQGKQCRYSYSIPFNPAKTKLQEFLFSCCPVQQRALKITVEKSYNYFVLLVLNIYKLEVATF